MELSLLGIHPPLLRISSFVCLGHQLLKELIYGAHEIRPHDLSSNKKHRSMLIMTRFAQQNLVKPAIAVNVLNRTMEHF